MRISELAESSGVAAATLRYYETVGLLTPERDRNGYRSYRPADVDRLRFVTCAKQLGLHLDEIAELVSLRDNGRCPPVRERIAALLADRLGEMRRSIADLRAFVRELDELVAQLKATCPPPTCGEACGCPDHPLQIDPGPPVACSLPAGEAEDRGRDWRAVAAAATSSVPTADGWLLHFRPDPQLAGRLAALAAAEQRCCPFLGFRIDVRQDAIELAVTAPADARPVAAALFATTAGAQPG